MTRVDEASRGLSEKGVWLLATSLMVAASFHFAFFDLFSTFSSYDDEGHMLMFTQLFLNGNIFYDQVFTPYGPFFLLYKWFLHAGLSIPVANDAIRFITLFHWVLLAATCGLIVLRISGSKWFALVGYGVVFYAMNAFHSDPGNPQELIAALTVMLPLMAWGGDRISSTGLLVGGVLCGLIFMSKMNIGLFCFAAISVVLLGGLRRFWGTALMRSALVLGSFLFPFVLMYSHFAIPGFLRYAILASLTLGGVAVAVTDWRCNGDLSWTAFAVFIGGFLIACIGAIAFMAFHGSTIDGLMRSVIHYASGQVYFYSIVNFGDFQLLLAFLSLALVVALVYLPAGSTRTNVLGSAKSAFVILTLVAVFVDPELTGIAEKSIFGWLAPWCWLCAVQGKTGRASTLRKLLAALGAWHVLLSYPVVGIQAILGNFLVITSAVVCFADSIRYVGELKSGSTASLPLYVTRFGGYIVVFLLIAGIAFQGAKLQRRYDSGESLDLPGARLLQISSKRARVYHELASAVRESDVLFTTTGFNSLFFWSERAMPAPVVVGHSLAVLRDIDRHNIMVGIANADNPVVVVRKSFYFKPPSIDLLVWINNNFEIHRTIGKFYLLKPAEGVSLPETLTEQAILSS